MRIKNIIKGNKTRIQDNNGAPARHIKLRIHVQNRMYNTFATKIKKVLETLHENDPIQ
jgi:hypothetical protein